MKKICILSLFVFSVFSSHSQTFNHAFAEDTLVSSVSVLNWGDTTLTAIARGNKVWLNMFDQTGNQINQTSINAEGNYIGSLDLVQMGTGEIVLGYHSLQSCDVLYPQYEVYEKYDRNFNQTKRTVITSGKSTPVVDSTIFLDHLTSNATNILATGSKGFRYLDNELNLLVDSVFQSDILISKVGLNEIYWRENPAGANPIEKKYNLSTDALANPSVALTGDIYELSNATFLHFDHQQIAIRNTGNFQILHSLSLPTASGLQPKMAFTSGNEIVLINDSLYEIVSATNLNTLAQGSFNTEYQTLNHFTDASTFNGKLRILGRVYPQNAVLQVFDYASSPAPAYSSIGQKLIPLAQRVDNVVQASSSLYRLFLSSDWRAVLTNKGSDTLHDLAAIIPYPGPNPGVFCFPNWKVRRWNNLNLAPGDSVVFNFTHVERVMSSDSTNATASASLYTIMANDNIVNTSGANSVSQNFTVGVDEYSSFKKIEVFPNPVDEFVNLTIESETGNNNLTVEVFDATGRSFLQETYPNQSGNIKLYLKHLPGGIYWLRIKSEDYQERVISIFKL